MTFPALLPGARCYTDAATTPHQFDQQIRKSRSRYLHPGSQEKIIDPRQSISQHCLLCPHGRSCCSHSCRHYHFCIADSEYFLTHRQPTNGELLQWTGSLKSTSMGEIKPLTQKFINITAGTNSKVAKITRNLNATAHSLATQAFRSTSS